MIFQYKGFNFKIDFEEKNIFSLIVENKRAIFIFSDYFNFDINKFVLNKYYKELKNLSENEFLNETLEIKEILKRKLF